MAPDPAKRNERNERKERKERKKKREKEEEREKRLFGVKLPEQLPFSTAAVILDAEKALENASVRLQSNRCILLIDTIDEVDEEDADFIPPITIGRMVDVLGYFFRVTHHVEYYESEIKEDSWSENDAKSVKKQVWPCNMWFNIELQYGNTELVNNQIRVDTLQNWWIKIPAKNPSPSVPGQLPVANFLSSVLAIKSIGQPESGIAESVLDEYLKNCKVKQEVNTLGALRENGCLHYMTFSTLGRMIVPSTSFKVPAEEERLQYVVDWLKKLRSDTSKDTKIRFQMIFYSPKDDIAGYGAAKLDDQFTNFRKAMKLENQDPDYFLSLYGTSIEAATLSMKKCLKEPELLPKFPLKVPLIWDDVTMMYLAYTLDMNMLYHTEREVLAKLEMEILHAYTLILGKGLDGTFGALIEIPLSMPSSTNLNPGTSGRIEFVDRPDMPHWMFVIAELPVIARTTDIYLVIRPKVKKDDDGNWFVPTQRPRFMIDLEEAVRNNTLQRRLQQRGFENVRLYVERSNVTEKQQYKALQIANPNTRKSERFLSFADKSRCTEEVAASISQEVTAILSGLGLENTEKTSFYTPAYVESVKSSMKNINQTFAKAIQTPGATISEKQLEFALDYPANAPADGKLVCNGYAGSSKSTCLGIYLSFQFLDSCDLKDGSEKSKRGLLLAKMHKTVNASIASIAPIVWEFTQKYSVREYTDKVDVEIFKWILNECPEQHWLSCENMEPSEHAEVNDVIEHLKAAIKLHAGNRSERFLGYENTAIWIASKQMGMLKQGDGRPKYAKKKLSAGTTTEKMTIPLPKTNDIDPDVAMGDAAILGDPSDDVEMDVAMDDATITGDPGDDNDDEEDDEDDDNSLGVGRKRKPPTTDEQHKKRRTDPNVDNAINPPQEKDLWDQKRQDKLHESADAKQYPKDTWKRSYTVLRSALMEILESGENLKVDQNTAEVMMRKFKKEWYAENVAVVGTTISKADSREVMDWNPTHLVGDEWQAVPDIDCIIPMTAHSGIPMYFVGDTHQPSPYVDDGYGNPYSAMRKQSWFEREIKRGRDHVSLNESRRTDSIGVRMASELFYGGGLKAVVQKDPEGMKIVKFYKKHFGTRYRHLFLNIGVGTEEKIGFRRSTINSDVIGHVVKLVQMLVEHGFTLEDIAIVAPYSMEEKAYRKVFREMFGSQNKTPTIAATGSILAMMGREAKIVIFSIAKTQTMGFLNTHGFWCVGMTRHQLSCIIVANDSALQSSKASSKRPRQFGVYNRIVDYLKGESGYASWPETFVVDTKVSETLEPSLERHRDMQAEFELKLSEAAAVSDAMQTEDVVQSSSNDEVKTGNEPAMDLGLHVTTSDNTWNAEAGPLSDNTWNAEAGPSSGITLTATAREFDETNWNNDVPAADKFLDWDSEPNMSNNIPLEAFEENNDEGNKGKGKGRAPVW